jgi:GntR family transcriptional regulator
MLPHTPSDNRLPAYQRLRDEFARSISERDWLSGQAIPPEQELARTTGTSVGTVRKAIEILVLEGLLERFQGRGTFVRRPSFDGSPFRFFRFETDSGERAVPTGRVLGRTVVRAEKDVALALQLTKDTKVIRMERLRLFGDDPVLIEVIWLPYERFKAFMEFELKEIGNLLYAEYERHCGVIVASAQETLSIARATAFEAKRLRLEVNDPVIAIERMAFSITREPLEFRRSRGPASRFRYHVELR